MSPAAMARGKASGGKKPSSGGVGSALDASRGADAKERALRAECLKCYEIFTKKGALARATKELDKLVDANPKHPLVRYARARLAHRDALDQTRPEMVEKKFKEAKKAANAAAAACPNSIILKTMFSQMCLDCPDEETDDLAAMMREVHALVNSKIAAANDPRAASESTNDADAGEVSVSAKKLQLEAFAEGFKEEFTACLELDKDVLSMIAFPRVNLKGMKSKTAPKAYDFLSGWIKDRFNLLETEKENYIRMARLNARGAGTSAGVADFSQAYVKYRDVQRKNALAEDRASERAVVDEETQEYRRRALLAAMRRQENQRRTVFADPDVPQAMDVDGGDGTPPPKADSPPAKAEKASAASRLAEKPRPSNAAKVENPNAVPAAVQRFWKAQVARDPSAVLRLTDVSVRELRAFAERDKSGGVAEAAREALRAAAERGAIRVWRCGVPAEACDADGTHASEEACLRCVERHVPRVSPALHDVGDARVWLAPIARPGDVALGSATPRPRGDGEPLTESDVSDACFSSELARSESGQSLLHETDAIPEFSCCLVRNGTYVPTPGWLGYRNAGRAAPLLSVDPDVLRRDAATLSAEARRAKVSDRPPGADDPALPEYEFAGAAANAFTIPNPPIFSEEEAELRARRVAAFEDALARLRVEGAAAVERLREHAQQPGVLPRLHADGEGGARGDGFLRENAGGFAVAERDASVASTGFLARLGDDVEALAAEETAGGAPASAREREAQKRRPRALGLREHAANLRSIQETLRARARASGSDASVSSQGPERAAYAAVAAELAPVEDPEHVGGEGMPSWTRGACDVSDAPPPAEDESCLADILASLRVLADAAALPLRALQSIAQFCAAREAARAEEKEASRGEGMRRRRVGVGLLGVSGRAERVLSSSPEAKAPVGRPTFGEPHASLADSGASLNAPVRGFDDLVARLRRAESEDLRLAWSFCRDRWLERAPTASLAARADGLTAAVPDALSERSPVFGLVRHEAEARSEPREGRGGDEKRKPRSSAKGGKGGKAKKDGEKEKEASGSREWVPGEHALALRVSRGVWRELYGDVCFEPNRVPKQTAGLTSKVPVSEAFLGEHLLKWLWKRDAEPEVSTTDAPTAASRVSSLATQDSRLARLEANDTLARGLLVSKLGIRRKVDACVVLAGRLATGTAPRDWDHASEAGRAAFRALWNRSAFLALAVNELRRALLELDVSELDQRRAVLKRLESEASDEYVLLRHRAQKTKEEGETAAREAKAKRQISAKLASSGVADAERAANERRARVVDACERRMKELSRRWTLLQQVEVPAVSEASQRLRIELSILERPGRSDREDVEMAQAEDGSPYLRCSRAYRARREADLEAWIADGGAFVPQITDALARSVARIPFRLATPLVLAQERLAKLDLQMEAVQSARAKAAAGADLARAAASGDAAVAALERAAAAAMRERLERLAADFAADEAVAEQERFLAEEGEASEARRAKEEKARAKRAKEKARAREARAAEEAAREAEKAAAARAAAAREADEAARRGAEEAARAAERRDSEEAAEAALAERREQLLVEEARHLESDRRALELAVRVSAEHERLRAQAQAEARAKVAEAERAAAKAARAAEDAEKAATSLNASASDFRPAKTENLKPPAERPRETVAAVSTHATPPLPPMPPPTPPGSSARTPPPPPPPPPGRRPPPGFSAQTPSAAHAWGAPAYASPHVSLPLDLRAAAAAAAARLAEANAEARLAQAQLAALEAAGYAAEAPFPDQPPATGAWPSLSPPAPAAAPVPAPAVEGAEGAEGADSEEEVDAQGFAVDDLEAALKASMTETKGRPPSPFDAASGDDGASSASPASALARSGSAAGLRNLEGEYNCFLNVVIQSLWHVSAFRDAMRRWEPSAFAKKQDTDVARALRDVFRALDAARDAARDACGEARPAASAAPGPAAPTALREALSALLDGEGALFAEREMADASEALQAIFHAVHRACAPATLERGKGGKSEKSEKNTRVSGAFLDEESRYRSLAHDIFGLDVDESVACGSCGAKTHALRYTKFLHLLPVAALNDACRGLGAEEAKGKNATRFARAIRAVDARDEKSCNADAGGCGRRQPLTHAVVRANGTPETFCVALTWETANADAATVRETVANVDERVSLRLAFGDEAAGPDASAARKKTTEAYDSELYALKCVLCYYGEHYCAFATEDTETSSTPTTWTLFDDATTKPVGALEDVRASCEKGRLQPCVLFYQKTHPREV